MKPSKRACIFRCVSKRRAGFLLALGLMACAGVVPEPGESQLRFAEQHGYSAVLPDLQAGRHVFLLKCNGCHSLPRLKRYAPEKWPHILDSMSLQAELEPRQDSLVRNFLQVASGQIRDSLAARGHPK